MLVLRKSVSKSLKFDLKWQFLYFKPILSAILVTIATGKSKINARILHLGCSSNKPIRMKLVKSNSVFGSRWGQNSPLMHVPLSHFTNSQWVKNWYKFEGVVFLSEYSSRNMRGSKGGDRRSRHPATLENHKFYRFL